MASPFEIFRRNQWLVVALFGLSIFAFILLDPLTSGGGGGDSNLFPIVLGVLLGGVAAWLISNTTGRAAVMWAAAGAVAGGLFVGLSGNFFGGNVAVQTTEGDLSRNDLVELQRRNQIANQFFIGLKDKLEEREPENERLAQTPPPNFNYVGARSDPFGFRQIRNILSEFDPNAPEEFGLVFAYLLGQEADEAGLEISDEYVNEFIKSYYGVSPTREEFRELRTRMNVGETDLFDAIRAELRHRRMFELLAPNPTSLPTDAWELYRQLNQSADVAYVELPAEAFVAEVAEPSDSEVSQLFDDYRTQQPDPSTGLGFMRPAQISLGYLTVDRDVVQETVPAPTDEEVRAYYEANKTAFRNPAYIDWLAEQRQMENQSEVDNLLEGGAGPGLPTLSPDAPAESPAEGPAMPADAPATGETPAPESETPAPESTDEPQPEPADEPAGEPAMTAPAEEPAPAEPPAPAEAPAEGDDAPEPLATGESDEPAMTPAAEPQPEEPSSEEPAPEEPKSEEPKSEEPKSEEPKSEESTTEESTTEEPESGEEEEEAAAAMTAFQAAGFASLPIAPQEENGEQPPAGEEEDGETETAADKLKAEADAPQAEQPPAEPAMAEEPADAPAEDPAAEPTAEEGSTEDPAAEPAMTEQPADAPAESPAAGADAPPEQPAAEAPAEGADAPPTPTREKPEEFLPLDAARTAEIRERLKREAVSEEMTRRIDAARDFMFLLGEEIWSEVPDPSAPAVEVTEEEAEQIRAAARAEIAERMETFAKENGLTYKRLPFLGLNELVDGDYPVGTAEIPGSAQTGQPQLAIAPLLGNFRTPLFNDVRVGETPDGSALYAIWKADQRLPAEQELSDEGVREAVVAAIKRQKAAEAAAARAKELAELASAEGKTLQQVVEGQTVTGKEGGDPLEVTQTGPFRRLRVNRPTGFEAFLSGPSPVRNPVPTFEDEPASEEFLDAAFNELKPGEAAGVPGFRPGRSFTVELKGREPSDERLSDLYESFLKEAAAEPGLYRQAGNEERRVALEAFINGLFEKYGVDRGAIGAMDPEG